MPIGGCLSESPYHWLAYLGRGSSGEVWAATRDNNPVAVKVLTDVRPQSPHAEAIQREVKIGRLIAGHPGVVAITRVNQYDGVLHLEMDWVHGPNLE